MWAATCRRAGAPAPAPPPAPVTPPGPRAPLSLPPRAPSRRPRRPAPEDEVQRRPGPPSRCAPRPPTQRRERAARFIATRTRPAARPRPPAEGPAARVEGCLRRFQQAPRVAFQIVRGLRVLGGNLIKIAREAPVFVQRGRREARPRLQRFDTILGISVSSCRVALDRLQRVLEFS